ncbi:metallophosphoesterase [Nocardia sp. NPDC058633]|uniref:metallophosphoesterase family protein n=1 Tax=Nocardia sp. NPDC058633 TaxID=3346568 RepID=UPI00365B5311
MGCCGASRRTVLAAAAGAMLAAAVPGSAAAQSEPLIALDLEIVTVTERGVVLTWTTFGLDPAGLPVPVPADTEVRLAPADSPREPVAVYHDDARTPYHYAEIDGLEPGRAYRFLALSNGIRALPGPTLTTAAPGSPEACGEFTTLTTPPGRLLHTIALANDVHYGETVSGIVIAGFPPGYRSDPPYPQFMLDALLDDARARDASLLLVAGDLTNEATADESRSVRAHLDTWGALGTDYLVARGNHDRPHPGYPNCAPTDGRADCWGDSFLPRQHMTEHHLGDLRILGLDTSAPDASGGVMDRPQLDALADTLRADPDRPTLVFGHHPVTTEAGFTNIGGPGFVLDRATAIELQTLYQRAPGVFLHHSGHTHRTRRTRPDLPCEVEFLEVGAVKEYPGGYCLLRIYDGGYRVNFYKTRTDQARRWSSLTRGQYFGTAPDYLLGTIEDRNHVVARDFSGL